MIRARTTHKNAPVVIPAGATAGDEGVTPQHSADGRNAVTTLGTTGLQRAIEGRDPWTWFPMMDALKQLAATGETFESWDLSDRFGVYLDSPGRYGALFRSAAQAGLIEHVGFAVSRRPTRSGGITRTWRGTEKARGRHD